MSVLSNIIKREEEFCAAAAGSREEVAIYIRRVGHDPGAAGGDPHPQQFQQWEHTLSNKYFNNLFKVRQKVLYSICLITVIILWSRIVCICSLQVECPAVCQPSAPSLKHPVLEVDRVPPHLGGTAPGFWAVDPGNNSTPYFNNTNIPPTQS